MADILYLIDRLEELLNDGFRVPMTTNAVIDENAFLDIIDQLRITIPNEIREAQRILQDRDRIIADAEEEANRLLREARLERDELVADDEIVEQARARAGEITADAHEEAEQIRYEADAYAARVLGDLEQELQHILRTVHNGLTVLEERGEALAATEIQNLTAEGLDEPPAAENG